MRRLRTYSDLLQLDTLEDRFDYLSIRGAVGEATFGTERYLNQRLYRSAEWRMARRHVILRDEGCDLGIRDFSIVHDPYVHHMNPMTIEQIIDGDPAIFDPEFLITVSLHTHNAIHYGDRSQLPQLYVERRPGDTKLW